MEKKFKKKNSRAVMEVSVEQMTSKDFQLDTFAHIDMNAHLLKDHIMIKHFQNAIYYNKHLFKGKIVLDVGCGIGILSLFAARAGAARVFSVDCSNVLCYTREIVKANKYDHIIKVIKGRIEDIQLPVKSVDIILSNWMGYCLLHQSAIDGVIFARDKWLKRKEGIIFPDFAKLYVAAIEDYHRKNEKINWWQNVYGFNMSCIREFALTEPCYYSVHPDLILSSQYTIKEVNMYTIKKSDLSFFSPFLLETNRSGTIDGIVTYFGVQFSKSHTKMGLATDPWSPNTHWMQTVIFFDQHLVVAAKENFFGTFKMEPKSGNLNDIDVCIEIWNGDPLQIQVEQLCQLKSLCNIATNPLPTLGDGRKKRATKVAARFERK